MILNISLICKLVIDNFFALTYYSQVNTDCLCVKENDTGFEYALQSATKTDFSTKNDR